MIKIVPDLKDVNLIAEKYVNGIVKIERVPKCSSTYVYRIIKNSGIYYIRFLPESASFATEVLVHNILYSKGVSVP
jgi:hypothetical protein